MRVWDSRSATEVTAGLTGVAFSLEKQRVVTSWSQQGELIESDDFTASLCNTLAGTFSHTQGADAQLWNGQETQIISHGSDNNGKVVFLGLSLLHQASNSLQRDDWLVDLRHKQSLQNDFVELLVCTAVEETVQLKENIERLRQFNVGEIFLLVQILSNNKIALRGYVIIFFDM